MALPVASTTPSVKTPLNIAPTRVIAKLDGKEFQTYKSTVFKSLDTIITQFTSLLHMKQAKDRLNQEQALEEKAQKDQEASRNTKPSMLKKDATTGLAFMAGALAVYLSDKIKKAIEAIYDWAKSTFASIGSTIIDALKVIPFIGPSFVAGAYLFDVMKGIANQFKEPDASDGADGDVDIDVGVDDDEAVLAGVLGDATEDLQELSTRLDNVLDDLIDTSFGGIFKDRPEPDATTPDMPVFPEVLPPTHAPEGSFAPVPGTGVPSPPTRPDHEHPSQSQAKSPAPPPTHVPEGTEAPPSTERTPPSQPPPAAGPAAGPTSTPSSGGPPSSGGAPSTTGTGPAPPPTTTPSTGPVGDRPSNVTLESSRVDMSKVNPNLAKAFYDAAREYGKPVRVNSAYRSDEYQAQLWARAAMGEPGIYIPARPMKSYPNLIINSSSYPGVQGAKVNVPGGGRGSSHLDGNALDITPQLNQDSNWMRILKSHGLYFPFGNADRPHIQLIGGAPSPGGGHVQPVPGGTPKIPPKVEYTKVGSGTQTYVQRPQQPLVATPALSARAR